MSYLIDDVARSLASPKPRREALKLVGRMLAGGHELGRRLCFSGTPAGDSCCLRRVDPSILGPTLDSA